MQKFIYTAVNIDKKKFKGTFLAEDENELKAALLQQNLYLVSAKPVSDKVPNSFFSVTGKLSTKELTSFCRQFCAMINSGISIVDSLEVLSTQSFSKFFQRVLQNVYEDVKSGVLLSEAMKKHKMAFPNFFVSMIFVGEASGSLDQVLQSLADYYDKEAGSEPKIVIVEPDKADCIYQTAAANDGHLHMVDGALDSIMAGLCCGEPCTIGWEVLKSRTDAFISMSDAFAARGMRILGNPTGSDKKVISGESGAATLGFAASVLMEESLAELKELLGLNEDSRILCISTEGATDLAGYRRVVWDGAVQF